MQDEGFVGDRQDTTEQPGDSRAEVQAAPGFHRRGLQKQSDAGTQEWDRFFPSPVASQKIRKAPVRPELPGVDRECVATPLLGFDVQRIPVAAVAETIPSLVNDPIDSLSAPYRAV